MVQLFVAVPSECVRNLHSHYVVTNKELVKQKTGRDFNHYYPLNPPFNTQREWVLATFVGPEADAMLGRIGSASDCWAVVIGGPMVQS